MLRSFIAKDPLANFLLVESLLTKPQLDTLIIHRSGLRNNTKLSNMVAMRDEKVVSKGSFLRTLSQGELNLRRAVYTIMLAVHLGLVQVDFPALLVQASQLLKAARGSQISPDELTKITAVLRQLGRAVSAPSER